MKKTTALLLALSMLISVFAVVPAFAATSDAFANVNVSGSDKTYNTGSVIDIVITIDEITLDENEGVSAFEFVLDYDVEKVEPVILPAADSDGYECDFSELITSGPESWETFGKHDSEEGYYELALGDVYSENLLTSGNSIVITAPFTVKEGIKADDIVFDLKSMGIYDGTLNKYFNPADISIVVSYALQPDELVTLPDGSIVLDVAGYDEGDVNVIYYASEEIKVGDYLANYDNENGMTGFGIIIVNKDGKVTYSDLGNGDKSSAVIPKGSYLIGVDSSSSDFEAFSANAVKGADVVLFNVNPESAGKNNSKATLNSAGFVITYPKLVVKEGMYISYQDGNTSLKLFGAENDISDFKAMFENDDITVLDKNGNEVTEGFVKTGMVIDHGKGINVVIMGDVNCDGKIGGIDYIMIKRHVMGTVLLQGVQLEAACVKGKTKPNALDYAAVKRHVIGTMNIVGNFKG